MNTYRCLNEKPGPSGPGDVTLAFMTVSSGRSLWTAARSRWPNEPMACLCQPDVLRSAADSGVPCCDAVASGRAPLMCLLIAAADREPPSNIRPLAECRRLAGLAEPADSQTST